MQVQVVDDLAALGPAVARDAIATFGISRLLAEHARRSQAPTQHERVPGLDRGQRFDVTLRHDEEVHGSLGVEILEGQHLVVLVHDVGRAFAGDDTAEHATVGHEPLSRDVYNTGRIAILPENEARKLPWAPAPSASCASGRTAIT